MIARVTLPFSYLVELRVFASILVTKRTWFLVHIRFILVNYSITRILIWFWEYFLDTSTKASNSETVILVRSRSASFERG
jgi:hypothetical protein